ncbi:MAG: hypothetical protein K0R82_1310 [Flavipsychrobacter sp.]|jgi:hypothetical protein|nr:hypothetical protein [Flavipsychrobacter sp.]
MSKQNGQGRIEQPNKRQQEQNKDLKKGVSHEDDKPLKEREKLQQPAKKPGAPGRQGNGRNK